MKITKEKFAKILLGHGVQSSQIESLWESAGGLNEELARTIARLVAPISKEVSPKS